jgi:putative acetyltransferase
MQIRQTTQADLTDILHIEREAFGAEKAIDELTKNMLSDPTATPLLSLLACIKGQPVGHILFTTAHLAGNPELKVSILAPLAVLPDFQRQGVGAALIKTGLGILQKSGVDLVFVLGHPTYYPRSGFMSAGKYGFEAIYSIPEKDADAWMVQALRPNLLGSVSGRVMPCEALRKPEHWRE